MNIDTKLMMDLQKLAALEPALAQELKETASQELMAERITAAASRHGLTLDAGELDSLLTTAASQARIMTALQELIGKDASLEQTLKEVQQLDQAVETIMASANRHGVVLDANELAAHLKLVSKDGAPEELSDEALADVTGGLGLVTGALTLLVSIVPLIPTTIAVSVGLALTKGRT